MPYDTDLRPPYSQLDANNYGERAYVITPGAADQLDATGNYFKYMTAATSGDVTFLGFRNADDDTALTMTVQAGQILPGRIRRVTASTASLHGWSD